MDDGLKSSQKYGSSGSIIKKNDFVTKNFWLNGYNGVWTIDHDDGSQFMNDTQNFMVCKTPRYRWVARWVARNLRR